jgi:putative endonuclease
MRLFGDLSKKYYLYLLTNKRLNVLYTGVTNHLIRRVYEHKNKIVDGFTKKYNVDRLVHYETYSDVSDAIGREKEIKGWSRAKKNGLINENNPKWEDLFNELN